MFDDPNVSIFFLVTLGSDCGLTLYIAHQVKNKEDPEVSIMHYCYLSDEGCPSLSRQPVMQEKHNLPL